MLSGHLPYKYYGHLTTAIYKAAFLLTYPMEIALALTSTQSALCKTVS